MSEDVDSTRSIKDLIIDMLAQNGKTADSHDIQSAMSKDFRMRGGGGDKLARAMWCVRYLEVNDLTDSTF